MQPKNMLTPHDFKLIEDLFDRKFEENAQSIIAAVNTIIDPMAKDVHILKKDVSALRHDVRIIRKEIGLLNEKHTTDQKRMDIIEERLMTKDL